MSSLLSSKRPSLSAEQSDASSELNLTPFIDVFVTLIVFLLLTAVFVHLGSLRVQTPGLTQKSDPTAATPEADVARAELSLYVLLSPSGVSIRAFDAVKGQERVDLRYANAEAGLSQYWELLKSKEIFVNRMIYQVSKGVTYQRGLDLLRQLEKSDLSPDIILAAGLDTDGRKEASQ